MAERRLRNIKSRQDDLRNTPTSTRSDFLSVSGNSEFVYVTGRESSTIRSDTAFSQQSAADEGSSFIHSTLTFGSESEYDDDQEVGYDFDQENMQFLKPENTTPPNDTPKCLNCAADEKHIQATHFCRSCRGGGMYICYRCLQSHNRWHHDHIVHTLSVSDESLSIKAKEDDTETKMHEDCEREKVSHSTLQQARGVPSDSSDITLSGAHASLIEHKTR